MIPLLATIPALGLSLAVDVVGWSCDRFADVAEPAAEWLADKADHARWIAKLTRCAP